ncbi:MAG: rhamnulose-1-phosphate aldolase [Clostridia bacterium]|nr:rhamnulose-1-phosphate aldolase [Clostridia bacterium]MBR5746605.1 rhamnulose-1-phosphate aldolase [Clostridia bacterium]
MGITELGFYREAVKFTALGASFGWHERNAGNISLWLDPEEVASAEPFFVNGGAEKVLAREVPDMDGEYIFTTATGSYFTDMSEESFCICRVCCYGKKYRVVWGAEKPTSELCGHLMSLAAFKRAADGRRAVYHCHPADLIALTNVLPPEDKVFTTELWSALTECPFVFPRGLGVVPFKVPGSPELADATAELIGNRDAAVWAFHGLFASGESIKDAFGVAHTVAKAAEIRLKIISSGKDTVNTVTHEEIKAIAEYFGKKITEF